MASPSDGEVAAVAKAALGAQGEEQGRQSTVDDRQEHPHSSPGVQDGHDGRHPEQHLAAEVGGEVGEGQAVTSAEEHQQEEEDMGLSDDERARAAAAAAVAAAATGGEESSSLQAADTSSPLGSSSALTIPTSGSEAVSDDENAQHNLAVLLNAIEQPGLAAAAAAAAASNGVPTSAAANQPGHPIPSSEPPSFNIQSLLAASQHLASPPDDGSVRSASQQASAASAAAVFSRLDQAALARVLVEAHARSIAAAAAAAAASAGQSPSPGPSMGKKRKWADLPSDDRRSKIRRTVRDHLAITGHGGGYLSPTSITSYTQQSRSSMTTVSCLHASVAQKSYGSEKRFLCPPPVVRITGPLRHYPSPSSAMTASEDDCPISMAVVNDMGDRSAEQKSALDEAMQARFKYLHVGGTAKAKQFRLQLNLLKPPEPEQHRQDHPHALSQLPDVGGHHFSSSGEDHSDPSHGHHQDDVNGDEAAAAAAVAAVAAQIAQSQPQSGDGSAGHSSSSGPPALSRSQPWASFESAPITIISKPSKKTAKTRNASSYILSGSLVSLFNRINSQTVRTKYMCVEDGRLCARNSSWSAFRITQIGKPSPPGPHGAGGGIMALGTGDNQPITYGSIVVLTDSVTGVSSDPLVVCKVDKGKISLPQLQPTPPAEQTGDVQGHQEEHAQHETEEEHRPADDVQHGQEPNSGLPTDPQLRAMAEAAVAAAAAAQQQQQKEVLQDGMKNEVEGAEQSSNDLSSMAADAERAAAAAAAAQAFSALSANTDVGASAGGPASSSASAPAQQPPAKLTVTEDANAYGPVAQMQKVALLRYIPDINPDGSSSSFFRVSEGGIPKPLLTGQRTYLCATVFERWRDGGTSEMDPGDLSPALTYPAGPPPHPGSGSVPSASATAAFAASALAAAPGPSEMMGGLHQEHQHQQSQQGQGHSGNGYETPSMPQTGSEGGRSRGGHHRAAAHPPTSVLSFAPPRTERITREDGSTIEQDSVEDIYCWSVVGISSFEYTFFEAAPTSTSSAGTDVEDENALPPPTLPITPFPIFTAPPYYNLRSHTLELKVQNYYYALPPEHVGDGIGQQRNSTMVPLEVWLGPLGPLETKVQNDAQKTGEALLTVQMPKIPEILKALDEEKVEEDRGHHPHQLGQDGRSASVNPALQTSATAADESDVSRGDGSGEATTNRGGEGVSPAEAVAIAAAAIRGSDVAVDGGSGGVPGTQNASLDETHNYLEEPSSPTQDHHQQQQHAAAGEHGQGSSEPGAEDHERAPSSSSPAPPPAPVPVPQTKTLPILFIRGLDGCGYHTGRYVAADDLIALVGAAGSASAANALRNLGVGIGGPNGFGGTTGAWSLRVV